MVSDRAREQWRAYVRARDRDTALFDERDELHRFVVGLHLRTEMLSTADLGSLLDEAGLDAGEREAVTDGIESGLSLLAAYDQLVRQEDEAYSDVDRHGGFEI